MDAYLAEVQRIVDHYKPLVEERTGVQLEDIVVQPFSQLRKDNFSEMKAAFNERGHPFFHHMIFYGFLVPLEWLKTKSISNTSEMLTRKGIIYAKAGLFRSHFHDISKTNRDVMHELGHRVHDAINPDIDKTVADAAPDVSLPFRERLKQFKVYNEERFRISSLEEGFADYLALNFCSDLYEVPMQKHILKRKANLLKHAANNFPKKKIQDPYDFRKYSLGYYFFSSIAAKAGPEIAFEAIRNPDVAFDELIHPDSYLERKCVIASASRFGLAGTDR